MIFWVWDSISGLTGDYVAFAVAETEEEAWRLLKEKNHTAWWVLRGRPEDRDDNTPCENLDDCFRPRIIVNPEAFSYWIGD